MRPDGHRDLFVQVEGVSTVRPSTTWLKRALNDPVVARALHLRDGPDLSWTDLYRLYEVVRDALGGDHRTAAAGRTSAAQVRRFRYSANSVTAAGDQARHGVESGDPPTDPMTLGGARLRRSASSFMAAVRAWLFLNGSVVA